ncbi:hypothetical protein JYQ62_08345 [Nostoc sp. UHCC 0702]|nr:hypothetical protein JYQ62_08345 [Nostoc sp. UHCC 0702]
MQITISPIACRKPIGRTVGNMPGITAFFVSISGSAVATATSIVVATISNKGHFS